MTDDELRRELEHAIGRVEKVIHHMLELLTTLGQMELNDRDDAIIGIVMGVAKAKEAVGKWAEVQSSLDS